MESRESGWALARRKALLAKEQVSHYFIRKSSEEYRPDPALSLLALFLCLLGFLGVAFLVYNNKFLNGGAYFRGLPTRDLFVLSLGFAASPFLVSILHRVNVVFLVMPTILVFLLYPILSPSGLPDTRDTIYNFQFAQAILTSGHWAPNLLVTNQAQTYSYFPASGLFNAELSKLTGLPLIQTVNWSFPVLRLLILPFSIYAFSSRLFGARGAMLSMFLYLGMPSIVMNVPTQGDFAVPWLALTLLAFALLLDRRSSTAIPLRFLLVVFSSFIIISDHLTSYLAAGILGGIVALPIILRGRDPYPILRSGRVFARYFLMLLTFVFLVSYPIINAHLALLQGSSQQIANPSIGGGAGPALGATFAPYQLAWILLAILLTTIFAFLALQFAFRKEQHVFTAMTLLIGLALVAIAVPFLATGFSFLALRLMEYSGLALAPAAAWWLVSRFVPGLQKRETVEAQRTRRRPRAWVPGVLAAACAFIIFTGGNLAPLSSRDEFASPTASPIDAARHLNENAYNAGLWAQDHLNSSRPVWGDSLVYAIYGGFGHLSLRFDNYFVFNGTSINSTVWRSLHLSDYIVTDVYMTQMTPAFPGPSTDQPTSPLSPAEVGKFNALPQYFDLIYQDSVFSVYVVAHTPSGH